MKTRFKHLSKSMVSILLALLMIVSTVMVGIVATNAAYVDNNAVGYNQDNWINLKALGMVGSMIIG